MDNLQKLVVKLVVSLLVYGVAYGFMTEIGASDGVRVAASIGSAILIAQVILEELGAYDRFE